MTTALKQEYFYLVLANMRLFTHITIGFAAFLIGVLSVWITGPATYRVEAPAAQMATTPAPDLVLPEVMSAVPDIEVLNAEAVYDSFGTGHVALDLRNNSDQDATYLKVESSNCRDGYGQGWQRSAGAPIIAAGQTTRQLVDYQTVIPGRPLTITFVTYANGTTAGPDTARPTDCKCASDDRERDPDQPR